MGNLYTVTASALYLRSSAQSGDKLNIITVLKNSEQVDVMDATLADWYKVTTIQRNPNVTGFAASRYLKQVTVDDAAAQPAAAQFVPVNLPPNAASRRNNHAAWQYPLSEPDMPKVTSTDVAGRINEIYNVINYIAVDTSARYRVDEHTYCNIYAYDYCYLCNVFLPRVWWTDKALQTVLAGGAVKPSYGNTVIELNANAIFRWLENWGEKFGWVRTYDLTDLQENVNQGKIGVISGPNKNPNRSGHICCVVPEKDGYKATRSGNAVVIPLLSQAGAKNIRFYSNNKWWLLPQIKEFGFWYNNNV
ncbi:hypothetical protein LX99_02719 [Mucilaginibacter oryzae]|uniref:SH3 domain-containing protein n=1 Tax=Mucilaginibacter oryzae TaxID=468058 RepID=A0A316H9V0_9SPHI|nr:SH3 domain-containing protein [Mucilaginibacter oryzae]PWK77834.1 hypothetical protein LX99_02719 [Mucilaginibacter oryzae]